MRRPQRIGVVVESPTGATLDAPTLAAVRSAAELLSSLGHHVEEHMPPVDERFAEDFALFWSTLALLTRETARLRVDRHFDKAALARFTHGLADNVVETPGGSAFKRLQRDGPIATRASQSRETPSIPRSRAVSSAIPRRRSASWESPL